MWTIQIEDQARKELRQIDKKMQDRILEYLQTRIATREDPTELGKPLQGRLKGLWRFRVGDYRIVTRIEKEQITILVIRIAHRKDVYE